MTPKDWRTHLLRPAATIAVIAILSKMLHAAGGVFIAHRFGATITTDAYVLAKSLPIGIYLVFDSLLYNAMVPVYGDSGRTAEARAGFLGAALVACVALAAILTGALALFADRVFVVLAPGAAPETVQLAGGLCRLMSIAVAMALPASLLKAVNACQGRYVLAALDGLVMSTGLILAVTLGAARWGIHPVSAALPASCAVLLLIQVVGLRGSTSLSKPVWRSPLVPELLSLMGPLVAFNCLHQINVLGMNAFMAGQGEEGSVSWLHYGYNVAQVPVSIMDLVLLSTVFPFAAARFSAGNGASLRNTYGLAVRRLVLALIPLSAWLIAARHDVIALVFRHGRFDAGAALGTGGCLLGLAVAVPPWAAETLAYRCLFAMKRHGAYARIVAARVATNLVLCGLLVWRLGYIGVPIAFAVSSLLGAFLANRAVRHALNGTADRASAAWTLLAATAAAGAAWTTQTLIVQSLQNGTGDMVPAVRLGMGGVLSAGIVAGTYGLWRIVPKWRGYGVRSKAE